MAARAVVAVAGMEGALASVIGGLVDCPVIAVPTSVGYGASFGGVAALLAMLNSCASGVQRREHRQRLRRGLSRQHRSTGWEDSDEYVYIWTARWARRAIC